MTRLRVAVLQHEVIDGRVAENLAHGLALLDAAPDADLYVLPELWTTGYVQADWAKLAREATPGVLDRLTEESRRRRAWIAGSQISINGDGQLVNRLWVLSPDGGRTHYDKAHLFGPMGEPEHLVPGAERHVVDVNGWGVALSLCFDLRFPEMYRLDALAGADVFLVASAWPAERAEAMRVLARARALENQAFVVLCNRCGTASDGTVFGGESMVVAPDGRVLASGNAAPDVIWAHLERSQLMSIRGPLSLLEQRRAGIDSAAIEPESAGFLVP